MNLKEIIERCAGSGLMNSEEESHFSWEGCDYCNDGLGNDVYDCEGYTSLKEARENEDSYYDFRLCGECLNKLINGE